MGVPKTYPALELFDGLMYRSTERQDLSKKQAYLQEHFVDHDCLWCTHTYEGITYRLDFMVKLNQLERL